MTVGVLSIILSIAGIVVLVKADEDKMIIALGAILILIGLALGISTDPEGVRENAESMDWMSH